MLVIFWDFIIPWVVSCGDYLLLLDLSYVEDMTFMLRCIWFCCDFMSEIIFMHDLLLINCRSDNYFLLIYLNCMIYCLIRDRVLHCSKVLITPSIAEDQKSKATANSNEFEGIGCLLFEERWQSTIVRSLQPLPPRLSLCLCYRTRITAMPATMFLHTWNGFEIDPS